MENSLESYRYESEVSYFWFDENNFVCVRQKDVVRTLEKQKKAFELLKSMMSCDNQVMLLDFSDCGLVMFDEKTKEYIAWTIPLLFKAIAIVAKTTLQKVAPTIFLNTMEVTIPVRIFDTEEEGKEWLKQFTLKCSEPGLSEQALPVL